MRLHPLNIHGHLARMQGSGSQGSEVVQCECTATAVGACRGGSPARTWTQRHVTPPCGAVSLEIDLWFGQGLLCRQHRLMQRSTRTATRRFHAYRCGARGACDFCWAHGSTANAATRMLGARVARWRGCRFRGVRGPAAATCERGDWALPSATPETRIIVLNMI